jgi:hypothetical protein
MSLENLPVLEFTTPAECCVAAIALNVNYHHDFENIQESWLNAFFIFERV